MPRLLHLRTLFLVAFMFLTLQLTVAVSTQDTDLKTMLLRTPVHDPVVFEQAHKYIQNMQSKAPCQQLAASTLIDGCQSLDVMGAQAARLSGKSLEEVKKEYATRLAICELRDIEGGVPDECILFNPTGQACGKPHSWLSFHPRARPSGEDLKNVCYPAHTSKHLENCYSRLYKTPQMWVSLSNAQNNAHIICQASRSAVENDEHLNMLKESVKSQHHTSEALSRLLQETASRLEEHYKFVEIMRQFQADVTASQEAALANADGLLDRLMANFGTGINALFGTVAENTDNVFKKTRASLKSLHDDATEHHQAQAAFQEKSLRAHQALVEAVDNSLIDIRDIHMADIIKHAQEAYNLMTQSIFGSQQLLESQLALNMYQNRTLEAFESLNNDLANQRILIDENSGRISAMSIMTLNDTFRVFLSHAFNWIFLAIALRIVYPYSRTLAAYMGCGGVIAIFLDSWLLDLLQSSPSLADYPQLQQAVWICGLITLTAGALAIIGALSYRFLVLPARDRRNNFIKSKSDVVLE
ncbi:uncharacterized protein K452DRAFT_323041 [Aplosporella prunicola CBS 121167]|uniref:Nuclear fusion protein KAR5 n=1 Tax=Aplosporella prunicola CBS 121167 TaxID=1176127 RepID=A0A6A6AXE6_9PEZI|nr:uncharacterized protein K452DRAFT_323041 [Aplosporella prunicola CBS 121167]KAF2135457.1 hypothetical protein K452DRAFT_323041 [Aplosporella prunicola CBS 121167]